MLALITFGVKAFMSKLCFSFACVHFSQVILEDQFIAKLLKFASHKTRANTHTHTIFLSPSECAGVWGRVGACACVCVCKCVHVCVKRRARKSKERDQIFIGGWEQTSRSVEQKTDYLTGSPIFVFGLQLGLQKRNFLCPFWQLQLEISAAAFL